MYLKNKKKFLWLFFAAVLAFSAVCYSACKDSEGETPAVEQKGPFYSLEYAYNKGFLTTDDLQTIADYHNKGFSCSEPLESETKGAIIKDLAEKLRNKDPEHASDITEDIIGIIRNYGSYHGYVVVMVDRDDLTYAQIVYQTEIVGGITFTISQPGPEISVWKPSSNESAIME